MRGIWFGFGLVLFIANIWCGFLAALAGSLMVFVHALALLGLGWSLDSQLERR